MKFYQVSPQSFSLTAPRIQDAFNHVFWFKSAMEKATNEMFSEIDKMKDSVDQEDIQQSMNYIQNCLHLQTSTMGYLGKALDDVLDTSMSLASNLLLTRRDNFLKLCHRDVTDKDIGLRNASLTKKELFDSKVLSEVEQNFIQWSQISREPAFKKHRGDSYGSRSFPDSKKDQSQNRYQNAAFQNFRSQSKQNDQNKRSAGSYNNSNRGSARGGRGRRK